MEGKVTIIEAVRENRRLLSRLAQGDMEPGPVGAGRWPVRSERDDAVEEARNILRLHREQERVSGFCEDGDEHRVLALLGQKPKPEA